MENFDDDDVSYEDIEYIFMFMLENGYMEEVGLDSSGEPIYRMTPLMYQDFPDLFDQHMQATNEVIFSLWQKNMLEMNMDSNGEWTVIPTDNTLNYKNVDVELEEEEIYLLEEIARVHTEKNI